MLFNSQSYITSLNCVYGEREQNYAYINPSPRKSFCLIYTHKGSLKFVSPTSGEIISNDGDFVLIVQNKVCSTWFLGEQNINFNFFFTLSQPFEADSELILFKKSPETTAIMQKIISHYNSGIDNFYILSYLYRILHQFNKSIAADKRFEKILPAVDYITQNFKENHSISHYARLCAMSETAFRKSVSCRLSRGLTP